MRIDSCRYHNTVIPQLESLYVTIFRFASIPEKIVIEQKPIFQLNKNIINANFFKGSESKVDEWKGKNIITIGGGIGQAPLRPIVQYVRANRSDYAGLTTVYGARTSKDICFKGEFKEMGKCSEVSCHLSVDVQEEDWSHYVGFVPSLLMEVNPSPENTIAITCWLFRRGGG